MRIIEREVVVALIFSKEGKLFQAFRSAEYSKVFPDCWHVPGGGVEEGEDLKQALVREIGEELGLDISVYELELVDDLGKGESEKVLKETGETVLVKMKFYTFKVVLDKNANEIEIHLNEEFTKYQWFDLVDLKNTKCAAPSVELFKRLGYL